MRARHIAILVVPAAAAALCAAGASPALAHQRHSPHQRAHANAPASHRARHARQMDTNDVAGHGAWLGCASRHPSAGARESASLAAVYCGRAPVFLAATGGAADTKTGWSA
jgi:hypothetical protein